MSPHLRTMLDDAADDGGRPVPYDLAAVRAAGRRSVWRRRAVAAGGGLGAAAVITSVALLLGPGTAPAGPAEPAVGGETVEPEDEASAEAVEVVPEVALASPLYSVLLERGYELGLEGGGSSVLADGVTEADSASAWLTSIPVSRDGGTGTAVVVGFTGGMKILSGLVQSSDGSWEVSAGLLCAPVPVQLVDDFAWEPCSETVGPDGDTLVVATGGDADATAVGATLLRADGTGVSVSLSTAPYERSAGVGTVLPALPLTADELGAIVTEMAALQQPGDEEEGSASVPPPPPPSCPPPPADGCEGSQRVDPAALVAALGQLGLEPEAVGDAASGVGDGRRAMRYTFLVGGPDGTAGSAAVGLYTDLSTGQQAVFDDGAGSLAGWCAVEPSEYAVVAWTLDGEPATDCDSAAGATIVLTSTEDGAALAATRVRDDGSVISVSISRAPSTTVSAAYEPLASLPFDQTSITVLLDALDEANPLQ